MNTLAFIFGLSLMIQHVSAVRLPPIELLSMVNEEERVTIFKTCITESHESKLFKAMNDPVKSRPDVLLVENFEWDTILKDFCQLRRQHDDCGAALSWIMEDSYERIAYETIDPVRIITTSLGQSLSSSQTPDTVFIKSAALASLGSETKLLDVDLPCLEHEYSARLVPLAVEADAADWGRQLVLQLGAFVMFVSMILGHARYTRLAQSKEKQP